MMKHFSFNGLFTRKNFWMTQLGALGAIAVSMAIMFAMIDGGAAGASIVMAIPMLAGVVASWAALAKRVRDTGNSAWLALLTAIPYVGIVPFLYFGCTSKSITNNIGMDD